MVTTRHVKSPIRIFNFCPNSLDSFLTEAKLVQRHLSTAYGIIYYFFKQKNRSTSVQTWRHSEVHVNFLSVILVKCYEIPVIFLCTQKKALKSLSHNNIKFL